MIPVDVVLPAAAAGVFVGLAVRAAWPARPNLSGALDRLDASKVNATTSSQPPAPTVGASSLFVQVGERLWSAFGIRLTLPTKDLALLGISPAEHLGKRALFALYGLLAPQLLQALFAMTGDPLPFTLPAVVSLVLAAVLWLAPARDIKREAAAVRLVVRHAAASYLERVALARIANSGAAQALTQTADVGDGFIFVRMRQVFGQAELSGVTPWDALKQLGEELDIPELTRPADTLALAGEGAAVYATLQAQARQLRIALLSDAKADANAASAAMILPVALGVILMLTFVMIPVVNTILAS